MLPKIEFYIYSNNSSQVPAYVEGCTTVHQLSGSPWDFTPFQVTQKFVNGFSSFSKFVVLCEQVHFHWHNNNSLENMAIDFHSPADEALEITIALGPIVQKQHNNNVSDGTFQSAPTPLSTLNLTSSDNVSLPRSCVQCALWRLKVVVKFIFESTWIAKISHSF